MNESTDKEIIKRFRSLIKSTVEISALKGVIDEVKNEKTLIEFYEIAMKYERDDVIKCLIPNKLDVCKDWFNIKDLLNFSDNHEMLEYMLRCLPDYCTNELAYEAVNNLKLMKFLANWNEINADNLLVECNEDLNLDVIKFLVNECDADIHVCEDLLFWSAVKQGDMDVAFYIIEHINKHNQEIFCKDENQTKKLVEIMNEYMKYNSDEEIEEESSSDSEDNKHSDSDF